VYIHTRILHNINAQVQKAISGRKL